MRLGLENDGTLEVPPGPFPAGWFTGAPTPGELGPAVIAGHVRWDGEPAAFLRLSRLRPKDMINVVRKDGGVARFRVTEVDEFKKRAFPSARVYSDIEHAGLRLITCGGFDPASGRYTTNVVVFAELVDAAPGA
jgi:sortase (surface protein transpeptidase)